MKRIDLNYPEKNDVKYRIDRFPDGEVQLVFTEELNRKDEYEVLCRVTNAEELFVLLQVGDILDRQAVTWNLHIRYLMGMRMDRVMSFERPFTLRVVGKMISQMGYGQCTIDSPHSEITMREIRNATQLDMSPNRFLSLHMDHCIQLVYPDYGALCRYAEKPEKCVYFEKERDLETGRIKSFNLMNKDMIWMADEFLFYDDLCDAGGTFLGELKILKEYYPSANFYIMVTHIVNEIGFDNLCKNFDKVFATESYWNWGDVAKEKGYDNFIVIQQS